MSGLYGCASKTVNPDDPVALLADAEEEIKSDHFQIGLEKLRVIRNRFPYSKASIEAQLRMADVYFLQEAYPEAAAAYEAFVDLHPKHEKVHYAMFRIAKAYFNDIPSPIARDMSSAQRSLDAYSEFLHRFPAAPEAAEAKQDIAHVRSLLAEKEMYIGDFYFSRGQLKAAKPRYLKVIELYPDTKAAELAKEKVAKIDGKN